MQTTLDYLSSHFMPFLLNYWLTTQHPVIRLPVFFMGICAGILCTRSKQGDFDAFQSKANFFLNSYFYGVLKSDTQYNVLVPLFIMLFLVMNDTKLTLNNGSPFWYHLEPSDIPYSLN